MKKILVLVGIVILIIFGLNIYQRSLQVVNKQAVKKNNVSQSITEEGKLVKFVSYQIDEGKTALDLLNISSKVKSKGEGVNAYILSINGREATSLKKEYWAFYINGKLANVGAGSYKLKSGDKIEWKIEKY